MKEFYLDQGLHLRINDLCFSGYFSFQDKSHFEEVDNIELSNTCKKESILIKNGELIKIIKRDNDNFWIFKIELIEKKVSITLDSKSKYTSDLYF